jgi:hypothetical protein
MKYEVDVENMKNTIQLLNSRIDLCQKFAPNEESLKWQLSYQEKMNAASQQVYEKLGYEQSAKNNRLQEIQDSHHLEIEKLNEEIEAR